VTDDDQRTRDAVERLQCRPDAILEAGLGVLQWQVRDHDSMTALLQARR
jgi:hypothetical protein